MKYSVSVIIPFYNGVPWLIEAVESVLKQKYPVSEILIINDGSNENLEDFFEVYKDKVTYIYKENSGPASARNLGIEKSTGDYIAFLDSDDIWLPDKLNVQIELMRKNEARWSHTAYELFDSDNAYNDNKKIINIEKCNGMIYPEMLISNNIATPTVVIEGDFLRNNLSLRFNKDMRYGQDQYLWINIALENEILAINQVLTKVRMRGSNAALRARVQLRAKSIIWSVLQSDKEKYGIKRLSLLTKLSYLLCSFATNILTILEKKTKNIVFLEWMSKCLYAAPWIILKLESRTSISKAN